MKKILLVLIFVLLPAKAKAENGWIGAHVGMGTNFQSTGNLNVGAKLRALKYCPFGLEVILSVPYGVEIMAPLYVFKSDRFKFHILPLTGIHIPFSSSLRISASDLPDMKDLIYVVLGAGAEMKFAPKALMKNLKAKYLTANVDWRVFVPNPVTMIAKFGDYGLKTIGKSFKEGEIWLGATLWY